MEEIAQLARQGRPSSTTTASERGRCNGSLPGESEVCECYESRGGLRLAVALEKQEGNRQGSDVRILPLHRRRPRHDSERLGQAAAVVQAGRGAGVSYYKFERERYGDQVMRFYQFRNDEKSKLGKEPLPDGGVMALRTVDR